MLSMSMRMQTCSEYCYRKQDLVSKREGHQAEALDLLLVGFSSSFRCIGCAHKKSNSKTKTHNAISQNKAKQNTSYKISRYIPTTMNKKLLVLIAMMLAAASSAAKGKADMEYVTGSFSLYNCLV